MKLTLYDKIGIFLLGVVLAVGWVVSSAIAHAPTRPAPARDGGAP